MYNGKVYTPSKEEIEDQISSGFEEEFVNCSDLSVFAPKIVSTGEVFAVTSLKDTKVEVNFNFPVNILSGDEESVLINYNIFVPSRLNDFYNTSILMSKKQITLGGDKCDACMIDILDEKTLSAYIVEDSSEENNLTLIYHLYTSTENPEIADPVKIYIFAHKFSII